MLGVGYLAYKRTQNLDDYILGGRSLGPWVSALSAGASDMSGWLLMGLPGLAYSTGMGAFWVALGLLSGTYVNWSIMANRLRAFSIKAGNALTIPSYLEHRFNNKTKYLRVFSGVFILIFFTIYTASGLIAGGKLFEEVFHISYFWSVVITSSSIVAYAILGGFLAVSWTDVIQGLLMSFALLLVPLHVIWSSGGLEHTWTIFSEKNSGHLLNWLTDKNGIPLSWISILSFLGWGLGYMGQPHILARFKAIKNPHDIPKAKRIATCWTFFCLIGAAASGLSGLGYFPNELSDPETVFMTLVNTAFNPLLAGVLLAAILAAIMSTADSQLLVASSTLTEDLYRNLLRRKASDQEYIFIGRLTVVIIAIAALFLALVPGGMVLDVAAFAWAGFGATFGPILLLSLYWRRMNAQGAIAGIFCGGLTVLIWKNLSGGIFELYEIIPGIICSSIAIVITTLLTPRDLKSEQLFTEVLPTLN